MNTFLTYVSKSEDIKGQLEWLRTHKEPLEDVRARWEATHSNRLYMLRNTQSTKTIYDYFNDFSVLKQSFGYTLVSNSFETYVNYFNIFFYSKLNIWLNIFSLIAVVRFQTIILGL